MSAGRQVFPWRPMRRLHPEILCGRKNCGRGAGWLRMHRDHEEEIPKFEIACNTHAIGLESPQC